MTTTMTLADLAATSLSAIRILEHHGLDYCCGGKQPFDDACLAKGVKPEKTLTAKTQSCGEDLVERGVEENGGGLPRVIYGGPGWQAL